MTGTFTLALLLICLPLAVFQGAKDKRGKDVTVCKQTAPFIGPSPSKPVLPSTYIARIECNIVDKAYSTDVHEYYDQNLDAGSVHQLEEGIEEWGVYDYKANELLVIDSVNGLPIGRRGATDLSCEVDKLSTDQNNFLFGYKPGANGSAMIFSANGALKFGGSSKETYLGKSVVRGINVDGWRSCLYWDSFDATLNVDWYFSTSSWNASIGGGERVPVRAHVYGKVYDTPTNARSIEHYYEVADFRSTFYSPSEFEVPKGAYCPGRKNMLSLPVTPSYFSLEIETVYPGMKLVDWTKEYYDFDTKLVRFDVISQPNPLMPTQNRKSRVTTIQDFNTGIAYTIDRVNKHCNITPIDRTSFDVKLIDGAKVKVQNPQEFFNFAQNKYVYEGRRKARDIDCDVWIAKRTDWPPGTKNLVTIWEWYFATQSWLDSAGETYIMGQPIMIEVYSESMANHWVYNIYNYDEDEPNMWDFNLLPCFNYTNRQDFEFKLPGKFKTTVLKNEYNFRRAIYQSVANFVNISPIRITNLKVDYGQGDIIVFFSMLDKAPVTGDAANIKQQTSVAVASDTLASAIRKGQFLVKVTGKSSKDTISLQAMPLSLSTKTVFTVAERQTQILRPKKKPYTSGHLVAVGLSMLFGCFIIACAITFFVYKKKGGSWSSFQPKTFDNEK